MIARPSFWSSSIGSKVLVAVTGLMLVGFVFFHLAGNTLVYAGREAMNTYAETLQGLGALKWLARGGLLAALVVHVTFAVRLQRRSRESRPTRYAAESTVQASFASRSMLLTGLLVLAYVLMHLAHFTFGWIHPEHHALTETLVRDGVTVERPDVYAAMIAGYQNDFLVLTYLVGMVVLGIHTSHGIHSLFQTLGFRHPRYTPLIERLGTGAAWAVAVGFMTIPLSARLGWLPA